MKVTVTAAYKTHTAANQAMNDLLSAGFDRNSVSLVMSKATRERHYSHRHSATAWGAGVGAIVGGLAAVASVAPPMGVFVAGPLLALIGGSALGAAGGGLVGALLSLGIPEERAHLFAGQLEKGGVLVAVEAENARRADEAQRILLNVDSPPGDESVYTTRELSP